MTKKQMKQLATKIANLETVIQTSTDSAAIQDAKERMLKLNESVELEFNEMIQLDEMVSAILKEKI